MANATDTRESALEPGAEYDRYKVEALLGTGGMASVYRVRHRELGSLHALKVLHHAWPALRQRLLAEGRAQAGLRQANIVAVTDTIDVDGRPGLVMDLIEGPNLEELMAQGRLDWETVDLLAEGILRGVAAAHKKGVVHRDLKPSNVLVQDDDGHYIPKVADFGIAKLLEEEPTAGGFQTRTGVAMGTPAYMAPEQVRNAKGVDHRADIWSLGVILYELVTGTMAFPQTDLLAVFNAVCSRTLTPIRSVRADVPERMMAAIDAALVVDRDARVADCDTLLNIWRGKLGAPASLPSVSAAKATFAGFDEDMESVTIVPRTSADPAPQTHAASAGGGMTPAAAAASLPAIPANSGSMHATALDVRAAPPEPEPAPSPRPRNLLAMGGVVAAAAVAIGVWTLTRPAPTPPAEPAATAQPGAASAVPVAATAPAPEGAPAPAGTTAPPVAPTPVAKAAAPPRKEAPRPPATQPAPASLPTSASAPVPQRPPEPSGEAADTLEVSLKSYPLGATVKMFGRVVCTTPCKANLPVGSHLAEFSLTDGRTGQVVVNVAPGTTREVGYRFP